MIAMAILVLCVIELFNLYNNYLLRQNQEKMNEKYIKELDSRIKENKSE